MSLTVDTKLIDQQPITSQFGGDVTNNSTGATSPTAFQLFIAADIQKGDAAKAYREHIITGAVRQAYQGNADDIRKASLLSLGKTKIAKAYAAGFAVLLSGDASCTAKVAYKGKLAAECNQAARDEIDSKTLHSVRSFAAAFDAVMDAKPVRKAKEAPVAAAESVQATESESIPPSAAVQATDTGLSLADMVRIVANALVTGQLDADSHNALFSACEEWSAAEELADTLLHMHADVDTVEFTEA